MCEICKMFVNTNDYDNQYFCEKVFATLSNKQVEDVKFVRKKLPLNFLLIIFEHKPKTTCSKEKNTCEKI